MAPKIKIFFFCNLVFFLYALHYFRNINNLILCILISSIIFIIPGATWVCILGKEIKSKTLFLLYTIFLSTIMLFLGVIIHFILNLNINSLSLFIYLCILTNIGILVTSENDARQLFNILINRKIILALFIFLSTFIILFIGATLIVPPLEDNDIDIQNTAYGLLNTLTPLAFTDRLVFYDFSHPLLINFYSGLSILFFEQMSSVKYYYDYAQEAHKIIKQNKKIVNLPLIPLATSENERSVIEKINQLEDAVYKKFWQSPNILSTRLPHIFFGALSISLLYYLFFLITHSYCFSFLGIIIYISLPELFVSLTAGRHISITNFFSLILLLFYIEEKQSSQKIKFTSLLIGFFMAQASNKAILLPAALMLKEHIFRKNIRGTKIYNSKQRIANKVFLGFILGSVLCWLYGILIDRKTFLLDYFQYHFLNRFLHIKDNMGSDYPTVIELWRSFASNLGILFSLVSFCSVVYLLKGIIKKEDKWSILSIWFFFGGLIFSIIDWRQTYHLTLVTLPLIIATTVVISNFKQYKIARTGAIILFICIIMRNIYLLYKLADNFYTIPSFARW